jgi:FkbM family methyltransferase
LLGELWPAKIAKKVVRRLVGSADPQRDYPFRDHEQLIALKAREFGVRTILDIGANEGQFARGIREVGWDGAIVSFEPRRDAHAALVAGSATDPAWTVAERMAIGEKDGEATLNLAANSVSSSLLPVHQRSIEVFEGTRYVATEQVPVRRLDDVVAPAWQAPFAIKIDTQGFEMAVLRGATETLAKSAVVVLEMSLFPLYAGAASFTELYRTVEDAGFRCIALTEAMVDFPRSEILQVDGTFVRI